MFKGQRWIFSDGAHTENWVGSPYVIIANPQYFQSVRKDVIEWCETNLTDFMVKGTVITFSSRSDMILFKLAWA